MKFKIKRITLFNALSKVSRAVSMKSPLPSLTGIKFNVTDEGLTLTGSDSDITIQTTITDDIDVIETGVVVLSSRYILEIIRKIDAEYVDFSLEYGTLTSIKGGRSTFELNGTPASDYPRINLAKNGTPLTLNALILKEVIEQTAFATSDKETRPVLTGVNFIARNNQLICLATDSFRLSQKTIAIEQNASFSIIIPKKSLIEISRIIEKNVDMTLYISDRSVLVEAENYILQSRLIDGTFPDTSRLIADHFAYEMSINSAAMLGAISRASLLSSTDNDYIKLAMKEDKIILSSYSQEIGSVEENLSQAFFKGEPLSISCSARYLSEAIRAINTETIDLLFNDKMLPFIIKDKDSDEVIEVVLPVRTYY